MTYTQLSANQKKVAVCLTGVALSLLLVGVVSGTLIRHVIQIVPLLIALLIVARRPTWGSYAAMPLFLFWSLIMLLIWLYLLGVSRIASGRYTAIEIILTVVMALLSVIGVVICRRLGAALEMTGRAIAFGLFGILQFVAMWTSFLRPFANR